MRSQRSRLFGSVATLLFLMATGPVQAKTIVTLPYPIAEVWPTAIRYLRIDRGATISEKDPDSGYVLFDLPEGSLGKTHKGALELVRVNETVERDATREATRLVISLSNLPRHYEVTLLDKLAAKVKDEYGDPAPGVARKPAEAPARKPAAEADNKGNKSDKARAGDKPGDDKTTGKTPLRGDLPRPIEGELPRPERRQ